MSGVIPSILHNCFLVSMKGMMVGLKENIPLHKPVFNLSFNLLLYGGVLHRMGFNLFCFSDYENGVMELSECNQLLCQCPRMRFYPVENGVWLIPASGSLSPPNLMLYWKYAHVSTGFQILSVYYYYYYCSL